MRILFYFILLTVAIFAKNNFTEKRYFYTLDKTTIFKGSVDIIDDSSMVVSYVSPIKKKLIQSGNKLTIEDLDEKKTQIVDLSKRMDMNMYFSFMRAINKKDFEALKTYFDITKKDLSYSLSPKSKIKKAIEKMDIVIQGENIHKMMIYFKNRDTIEITIP